MAKGAEVAWVLRNANLGDQNLVDIALDGGHITAVGANLQQRGLEAWDLAGRVVLPGLVDPHVHLDKTYAPFDNKSGTLEEAIRVWREHKGRFSHADHKARALKAVRQAVANGATAMRTHVDVDADCLKVGFAALEALLELKAEVADLLELQIVALGNAGVNQDETAALRRALELGADLVGGAPALTDDPAGCLRATFDLAEAFGKGIDLHIDETENPETLTLSTLAKRTLEREFQGRVTAGHGCSLEFAPDEVAARVMDKVAEAGLNIVTLPSCNLVLLGRGRHPAPRGVTRVRELLARGVNVAAASDNVRDPFNPLGHYDPLFTANLTAHAAHLTGRGELDVCLELVTTRAARVMGLPDYGIFEGARADLVVLDTARRGDAVTALPGRLATFKGGRCVVRRRVQQTWAEGISWT